MNSIKNKTLIIVIIIVCLLIGIYMSFFKKNKEGFVVTPNVISLSDVNLAEDKIAINTLAQIARNLMSDNNVKLMGTFEIRDNLKVSGNTNVSNLNVIGATNINVATIDSTGNLKVTSIKIGDATLTWDSVNKRLVIDQDISTNNIQASSVATVTPNGKTTMGAKGGLPGIFTDQNQMKVHNFTFGNQQAINHNNPGMVDNKQYDYIRSDATSYAILNRTNTGHLGMAWMDGQMYWTYLGKNKRSELSAANLEF